MSRYTLNWNDYSSPKERAISFNNLFKEMLEENPRMNSYTLVLFYEDRTPMRIFDNRMPFKISKNGLTRSYIDEWMERGNNNLVMQTSIHTSRNEVYPHRIHIGNNKFAFCFFNGNFGDGDLWGAVREARSRKYNVPEAVSRYFKQNNMNDIYENIKIHDTDEYRMFDYAIYYDGLPVFEVRRTADSGEYHNIGDDIFMEIFGYGSFRGNV